MPKLPHTLCPICARSVAVRSGGELREHRPILGLVVKDKNCSGSGLSVEQARARLRA